jgi:hypothetical protein
MGHIDDSSMAELEGHFQDGLKICFQDCNPN